MKTVSKILQGLDETRRERVKRALLREASSRLDVVDSLRAERGIDNGSAEHEALLGWAFSSMSYSIEEADRQLQTQEVNRQ